MATMIPATSIRSPAINEGIAYGSATSIMEFRLVYEGSLKASTGKHPNVVQKHAMRRKFHYQLAELWKRNEALQNLAKGIDLPVLEDIGLVWMKTENHPPAESESYLQLLAEKYARNGYRFVPLVSKDFSLICGLDILFLRRENPGDLILRGGDVDNRIKTLLDALRMPDNGTEIDGPPQDGEDPFFCLLQNDSLVTELNVTTDRLLSPLKDGQRTNDVMLVIKVHVRASRLSMKNLELVG